MCIWGERQCQRREGEQERENSEQARTRTRKRRKSRGTAPTMSARGRGKQTYHPAERECEQKDGEHERGHEEEGSKTEGADEPARTLCKRHQREHLGQLRIHGRELLDKEHAKGYVRTAWKARKGQTAMR